jgi:oligoendopeptidase F
MSEPLQELQGKLNDASTLLRGLQMQDEVGTLFSQLYSYASLKRSEDNANPDAQARVDRVRMLGTRLSSATAFVEPEILAIEPQQLRNLSNRNPTSNFTNTTCKNWSAAVHTCARPKSKKCWRWRMKRPAAPARFSSSSTTPT